MTRRIKHTLAIVTMAALTAFAAPAGAADLGGAKPIQVPETVQISHDIWSGSYFGGHLGGAVDGDNDFVGGAHLGHNWQRGKLVFGAEGDLSFGDDTFGSIRGRLGVAAGPALFYGTLGLGIDDDDEGLVAGGGMEYKFAPNTSLGVEALNYDLEDNYTVIRGRLTWHFGGGRYR